MAGEDAKDPALLRRETRTALELAIVAFAPNEIVDKLAVATGLLEVLIELPPQSPPAIALLPATVARARMALAAWRDWGTKHKQLA
jgi:hypothetical protein